MEDSSWCISKAGNTQHLHTSRHAGTQVYACQLAGPYCPCTGGLAIRITHTLPKKVLDPFSLLDHDWPKDIPHSCAAFLRDLLYERSATICPTRAAGLGS